MTKHKNSFRQHIPAFVSGETPESFPFNTTEELLSLEVVQRYGKEPDFSHFAISKNALMEISDFGLKWWVVGYIEHPDQVNLPEWDGGRYLVELPNGKRTTLNSNEVIGICGNAIRLMDGTIARHIR